MPREKEPKFLCLVCDGERTFEWYEEIEIEVVRAELAIMKLCTRHAQKLDALHARREKADAEEKAEIERSVA